MQASSRHPPISPPKPANESNAGYVFLFVLAFVFVFVFLFVLAFVFVSAFYLYLYLCLSSPFSILQCGLMSPIQVLPRAPAWLNLNPTCHKYKTVSQIQDCVTNARLCHKCKTVSQTAARTFLDVGPDSEVMIVKIVIFQI